MPITTEHYMLEAFLDGDAYSSIADMRRFSTVDAQFNIMTDIVGDGRIDGWEIVPLTFPNIRITQGSGFIDGHYVVTFNDENFELAPNGTFYAYAQRRVGIAGTVGPRSDVASATYTDAAPPAAPSGFAASSPASVDPYFNVQLDWSANTEADFDHYEIERATSPSVTYSLVATVEDGTTTHIDSVDEDTTYTYRLYAVDESGFRSSASTDTHSTGISPVLPPDPMEVIMPASEGAVNVLWKRPETLVFSKIASWHLTWVRLRSDGVEIPSTQQTKTIGRTEFHDRLDNLPNGEIYKITLKTIDDKGRMSGGITRDVSPQLSTAPKDPEGIATVETELVEGSVVLDFDWTDGAGTDDPLVPYAYQIYVTIDGQQESQPIFVPIGEIDQRVELYTFDGFDYRAIPQNTLVTFRFTSVTENGIESAGNYVRFITENFAIPNPVAGLESDFNSESGKITVTWVNPSGIAYITMKVVDDDLDDDYPAITLVNSSIGLIEKFVFDAELNHTYTITVTPSDADGVAGPVNVIVEVTILQGGFPPPELPREIFTQSGDRQIAFSWSPSPSFSATSYNLYRKTGVVSVIQADWTWLDNIPKSKLKFVDYGLENDQVYSYYITAVDLYGQESLHLPDGAINLNYVESVPRAAGILTEPDNVQVSLVGDDILITWESLLEEFDAFTVYRSIGNLHSWEDIADLDRNSVSYLDLDLTLVDGTVFYYSVGKAINDSDIVVQASNVAPESSILLGSIVLDGSTFGTPDVSSRRDIKDLVDPLSEYTDTYVLGHRHRGLERFDPSRIDLNPELIITDWDTVDGRIFTTNELDISGTGHVVKIDGRFPRVLFEIDQTTNRLIFTEPIVNVDESGNVIGELPDIEVHVLGVEEIQGILDNSRFDNLHARQITFGRLNKEQMPSVNHEGRIRENLLPKSYLLERFSNHSFIVPQGNIDNTKTFGDGTTFYATIESDGLIKEVIDWDQEDDGDLVGFQRPSYATDTIQNLGQHEVYIAPLSTNDVVQEQLFDGDFFLANNAPNPETTHTLNKTTLVVNDLLADHNIDLADAAIDPAGQKLYYMTSGWVYPPKLFSIDLVLGKPLDELEIEYPVTFELADNSVTTFAFNRNENSLYIINQDNRLIQINMSTLQGDFVHPTNTLGGTSRYSGMAYDENGNIMYAISTESGVDGDKLWTIDLTTGIATEVAYEIEYPLDNLSSLTFDYNDNQLYALEDATGGSNLWRIDPLTGVGTEIGFFSTPNSGFADALEAPPSDSSFWTLNPDFLALGNTAGIQNDVYLRYKVDLDVGSTVGTASLIFGAHHAETSSVGDVNLRISILDPSQYDDAITLATEAIKLVPSLVSIDWSPPVWSLSEESENTSIDIRAMFQTFIDNSSYFKGRHIIFKVETLLSSDFGARRIANKEPKLFATYVLDVAEVSSDFAFQSEKSYRLQFDFADFNTTRWIRITSHNTPKKPNPIVDLKKRLRLRTSLQSGSFYVALGIREITDEEAETGSNGGVVGPVEWVGISEIITDSDGNQAPRGKLVHESPGWWREVEFDLERDRTEPYSDDANGILEGNYGVLEHLAFTLDPNGSIPKGPFEIYIDKMEQVDELLTAGTSQGIQISRDFGTSWNSVRYVETPVHKFYRAVNNPFIWAVATNAVLISVDPANWFETSGLTGIQYIRNIVEDAFGNMFISTDKGVYWFETALINNFSSWRQTQPVTAFTTDCYGMYHNIVSSGLDEIWVSTEIGIFKTTDLGETWTDTNMNTQSLPAYEFINISSDAQLPNIICTTRKHVLRRLGSETDFSVLANFEVQHNIFDIWKMEYFAGHVYVSTGKGVYWNSMDELFVTGINTVFERAFPGLNVNGQVSVAFGLDAVPIHNGETQLFIGQENRLMVSDEQNVLSIKEQFPNKELPSFFADDEEITTGYVYNAFNNVLAFREPQPVNIVYKAAQLPRKFFLPINGGWAQTNPSTDVFIHFNGIPKWLDFQLDESSILSEIQILQGKLAPIQGTLTDFNSLYPTASEALVVVLADITNMIEGGTNEAPLVNNATIIQFLQDYTRFLSLVTTAIVNNNDLDVFPKFNVTGFPASQREPGSRAAALETQEEFAANNSTGIVIDTYTGEIDFLTVFTSTTNEQEKQEYVFDKYDKLNITTFKTNVSNTGEFSHRELEDQMEAVNSGLSSHMSRSHYANLIKAGIFMELNHPFLFETHDASNVQSKYNAAHNNAWYDMLNSTVDYSLVLKVDNGAESRFSNDLVLFTENTYLIDRVWVATDNDIMQYQLDTTTGELNIEESVRPGNGFSPLFIWDIFVLNEDDIYVVAEEHESQVGHIYRTVDGGSSWTDLETINVPQQIYTFTIINGNKIAGTEDGIFFSDNSFGTWFPGNLTLSARVSSNSPSVDAFAGRVRNIETSTFLIAESDGWFYTSGGGLDWVALAGEMTTNGVTVVNKVHRFKNITWIGTDKGLYSDGNSVLSDGMQFGLQTELENSSTESANINVSDIATGADALYCCAGSKIYRFLDNEWTSYEVPDITSIHKIALRETVQHYLIIVAHNIIRAIDVTDVSGVFG